MVDGYSSYVQQLAWNVMIEAEDIVKDSDIESGYEVLLNQSSSLFTEQIASLTSYQMNFLKVVADNIHSGFMSEDILGKYSLGAKSNVSKIEKTLVEKELIEKRGKEYFFADPVFSVWFKRTYGK